MTIAMKSHQPNSKRKLKPKLKPKMKGRIELKLRQRQRHQKKKSQRMRVIQIKQLKTQWEMVMLEVVHDLVKVCQVYKNTSNFINPDIQPTILPLFS